MYICHNLLYYSGFYKPMIEESGLKCKGSAEYLIIWPYYILCYDKQNAKKFEANFKEIRYFDELSYHNIAGNRLLHSAYFTFLSSKNTNRDGIMKHIENWRSEISKSYYNITSWCILDFCDLQSAKLKFKTNKTKLHNFINDYIKKIQHDQKFTGKDEFIRVFNIRKFKVEWYQENNDDDDAVKQLRTMIQELRSFRKSLKARSDDFEFEQHIIKCQKWVLDIFLTSKNLNCGRKFANKILKN